MRHFALVSRSSARSAVPAAALLAALGLSLAPSAAQAQESGSGSPPQTSAPGAPASGSSTNGTTAPAPEKAQPPAPAPAQPTAPASTAPPAAPATAATPRLTYAGLIDAYYLYQFNNPKHLSQNNLIVPIYDSRSDTPTLSLAELNVTYATPASGGFGAKTTLIAGDTADINHGGIGVDPNVYHEAYFKNIQQLYGTYLTKTGYGVDFGKFYTPFGYEVTESNANLNYSRSISYDELLPFYHLGLRAYTPNFKGFVGTIFIVNAINDTSNEGVHDDNGDKGYIASLNYTDPKGKFVAIENIGYSRDKHTFFEPFSDDQTTLSNLDITLTPNGLNTIGFEYTYRQDIGSNQDFNLNGYAAYYQYQLTTRNSIGARYSTVDSNDLGKPYDVTVTYSIKSSARFLSRLEYRYDHVNSPFDYAGSSSFDKSNQNTVSASEVFTF